MVQLQRISPDPDNDPLAVIDSAIECIKQGEPEMAVILLAIYKAKMRASAVQPTWPEQRSIQ